MTWNISGCSWECEVCKWKTVWWILSWRLEQPRDTVRRHFVLARFDEGSMWQHRHILLLDVLLGSSRWLFHGMFFDEFENFIIFNDSQSQSVSILILYHVALKMWLRTVRTWTSLVTGSAKLATIQKSFALVELTCICKDLM